MKKFVCVLLLAGLVAGLVGCGGEVVYPSVSARDFNTRLANMSTSLHAGNLSEISTGVINASRSDFENLDGWYMAQGILGRNELRLQTTLGDRDVQVTLLLCDNDRVLEARYSFGTKANQNLNEVINTYTGHIPFDFIGNNLRVLFLVDGTSSAVTDTDTASNMLSDAIYNKERIHLNFTWDFTNSNGDDATIVFSFVYDHSVGLGDYTVDSLIFRLS